jgi:hypothetical protein
MRSLITGSFAIAILISADFARADFFEKLGFGKKTNSTSSISTTSLSQDQIVSGLKEALGKGVQQAIAQLGHTNGFMTNLNVRIPLPEKLQTREKTLRAMKQEKLADAFVATMNHAAEQAVPEAGTVFADAVKKMSIEDARGLLTGGEDSATQYFRRVTETNLFARFLPIVKTATAQTGVVSAYKNLLSKTGGMISTNGTLGGFANLGKSLGADKYLTPEVTDIDSYVTQKTMDGLFKMVAEQEKLIRVNPAARTTALLQKVFGAVAK